MKDMKEYFLPKLNVQMWLANTTNTTQHIRIGSFTDVVPKNYILVTSQCNLLYMSFSPGSVFISDNPKLQRVKEPLD